MKCSARKPIQKYQSTNTGSTKFNPQYRNVNSKMHLDQSMHRIIFFVALMTVKHIFTGNNIVHVSSTIYLKTHILCLMDSTQT